MPEWVVDELKALVAIEPELLPPDDSVAKYQFYSIPVDSAPGRVYADVLAAIGVAPYTHVVMVPWLKAGGADRGAIYHVRAIVEADPSARVLVIATENADSPWATNLPEAACFLPLGVLSESLDFLKQVAVATRLLVQLRPRVLHVINSRVGWEAIRRHGLALRQHTCLFASLFCDDRTARMVPVGYARDYLRDCAEHLDAVFSDNSEAPKVWHHDLGVPLRQFHVLPFPYDRDIGALPPFAETAGTRVLWAGRLDRQKRPDILAAVAEAAPDLCFDVFGMRVMGPGDPALASLDCLPNVAMHGAFARLEDVVTAEHFAYLHTCAWEGLPTILFDVAAAGLPICAPAVGGIPDFIDRADLIDDFSDVPAFVAELRRLHADADLRARRRMAQWRMLAASRRWPDFVARLQTVPGYLREVRQCGQESGK